MPSKSEPPHRRLPPVQGALAVAAVLSLAMSAGGPFVTNPVGGAANIAAGPSATGEPAGPSETGEPASIDAPSEPAASQAGAAPLAPPAAPLEPGIQYEDAAAHANDRIRFAPGAPASVPLAAAAGDRAPAALPQAGSVIPTEPSADLPLAVNWPVAVEASVGRAAPAAPVPSAAPARLRREVFGFLPYWQLASTTTRVPYALLSTIAYFSVGVDARGNLLKKNANGTPTTGWSGWASARMTNVINAAHRRGTRVVLTISAFAWTAGQAAVQRALLGSATARLTLARQIAAAVKARGADGVNLDFEPIASGSSDGFTAFVRTLRRQLDATRRGDRLTYDVTGSAGNYPIEAATGPGAADAILVMGYDYRTSGSATAGSIAPLAGPSYDIGETIQAYLARIPASRIILGLPWYGRAWSTATNGLDAATVSGRAPASTSVPYATAMEYINKYGRRWDPIEQVAWTAYRRQTCTKASGCVTTWRELYIDDPAALAAKSDLVNRFHLAGVGIWALGDDGSRPELFATLAAKFTRDTTAPLAGINALPETSLDEGVAVSWTATDDVRVVAYDVQASTDGGRWTPWLTATTAGSGVYPGRTGHRYGFRVRARDSAGNWSAWSSSVPTTPTALVRGGFVRVLTDGLAIRSRPDTSGALISSLNAGAFLAVIGGPVSADGYRWLQVSGPSATWPAVGVAQVGGWIAAAGRGATFVAARGAPGSTRVDAGIGGLSFGGLGAASVGVSASAARSFSPNGDGRKDFIRLAWTNRRAFDRLELRVFRPDGRLLGVLPLPTRRGPGAQRFDWTGVVGRTRLPDGRYSLQLVAVKGAQVYAAPSARPTVASQIGSFGVAIDRSPPLLTAAFVSGNPFSPNGDGVRDRLSGSVAGAGGATGWAVVIRPIGADGSLGPIVRTLSGGRPAATFVWDGRTSSGARAPDGRYRLALSVVDGAGNSASRTIDAVLDTRAAAITAPAMRLSPNHDGVDDVAAVSWTAAEPIAGTATIRRGLTIVRRWAFTSRSTWSATWTGTDRAGRAVRDGRYTLVVDGRDGAGNRSVASATVIVDRTAAALRWNPAVFDAADGDRLAATARVSFRLTRPARTTLAIYDASGALVRSAWSGRTLAAGARSWTWDGRNAARSLVGPGTYTAILTATGPFGTTVLARSILDDAFAITPSSSTIHAGQTLTVHVQTVEPLAGLPQVTFTQPGRSSVTGTVRVVAPGRYVAAFVPRAGSAGTLVIVVTARDRDGRSNLAIRTVTLQQ